MSACQSDKVDIRGYRPNTGPAAAGAQSSEPTAQETAEKGGAPASRTNTLSIPNASQAPGAVEPPKSPNAVPKSIKPTRISFDRAPIPTFINAVFAETLGFAVQIDPVVGQRTETITLKTGDPVAGKDLFDIAATALRDYGIDITVQSAKTLRFSTFDRSRAGAPLVIREGPATAGAAGDSQIYYYYQVRATNIGSLVTVLNNTFGGKLLVSASPSDNAILFTGDPRLVQSALELLEGFDKPRMAGKAVVTIEPIFFTPSKMAEALARVLRTAGYGVSTTPDAAPINVLALDEVGTVLVFASDDKVRDFAVDWARQLDAPRNTGNDTQAFVYFVQNTDADSLGQVINSALGGSGAVAGASQGLSGANSASSLAGSAVRPAGTPGAPAGASSIQAAGMRIAVDPARNALIVMGKAEQYSSILPLMRQMDRAPGEVLIEVVLAEVTITNKSSLGVEFDIGPFAHSGTTRIQGGTGGGLGVGNAGLSLRLLDLGTSASAAISALSTRQKVNILSNPRIVAKSGSEAHIQVGTQVPVLRQQSTNVLTGQNGVTNSVDYIDTGVVLDVRPIIRADSRIDLEVKQEVSEAQSNDTSSIQSPLIFTRSLQTSLSLNNGQTVLLGGLKSSNRSNSKTGVPGLSRVPGIGALFTNQSAGKTDTELLIFMTPQIVTQPNVANEVVARYKDTMKKWAQPSGALEWW